MLPIQKEAARQFAMQPEGFDPNNRRDPSSNVSRAARDQLEVTRKLAEEQWVEEHKFQPPKALDQDEHAFLQQREEASRLRTLERQLAEMSEVEQFHNDVSNKVYSTFTTDSHIQTHTPPLASLTVTASSPQGVGVVVVASTHTKRKAPPAVKMKIVPQKRHKDKDQSLSHRQTEAEQVEPGTPKDIDTGLGGLVDYGTDSDD